MHSPISNQEGIPFPSHIEMGILYHHIWGWGYSPTPFMEEYTLPLPNGDGHTLPPHMGMGIPSQHIWDWVYSPTSYGNGYILPSHMGMGILTHLCTGMDIPSAPHTRIGIPYHDHKGMGVLSHPICRWVYSPTPYREGYTLPPHMGLRRPSHTI